MSHSLFSTEARLVNGRFRAGKLWDGTAYQTSKGGMVVLDVGWVTQNIWEGTKRSTCAAGIDPNTVFTMVAKKLGE